MQCNVTLLGGYCAASVSWLAAGAFLGSLLVAAAVAHVFGIIDFRPSHTAAKLAAAHGSPGSVSATSTDDSPLRHSSLGSSKSFSSLHLIQYLAGSHLCLVILICSNLHQT